MPHPAWILSFKPELLNKVNNILLFQRLKARGVLTVEFGSFVLTKYDNLVLDLDPKYFSVILDVAYAWLNKWSVFKLGKSLIIFYYLFNSV